MFRPSFSRRTVFLPFFGPGADCNGRSDCDILIRLPKEITEPMKILITAPSLDEKLHVSGISTVVRQIIGRGKQEFVHFEAGLRDGGKRSAGWAVRQAALPIEFRRTLKRERIEIAHINTALNPLSIVRDLSLAVAARSARVPVLLHIHGGKFLAREFESRGFKTLAEKMLRLADEIIVLSRLEEEIITRRWPDLRVTVLENAVDLPDLTETSKKRGSVLFLGRLHESKGLDDIIEAVRRLVADNTDFRFRAFGGGEKKDEFAASMSAVLGERFHFGGVIAGEAKRAELAAADIFILPSRYGEGLPMAMLEAMAARCVVIVSEMASTGAVIVDGVNGFLIEPGNAAQLSERLSEALARSDELESLRDEARRTVAERFGLDGYIERLEAIYERIAKTRISRR